MRPRRCDFEGQREERALAEQRRHRMLRLAQRNRRFAGLVERQARQQEESREKRADLAMAQSLRDTAEQFEARVRDPAARDLLKSDGPGSHRSGSGA
jgi:hypothetical protein